MHELVRDAWPIPHLLSGIGVFGMILLMGSAPIYWAMLLQYQTFGLSISRVFRYQLTAIAFVRGIGTILGAFALLEFALKYKSSICTAAIIPSIPIPIYQMWYNLFFISFIELAPTSLLLQNQHIHQFIGDLLYGFLILLWGIAWFSVNKNTAKQRLAKVAGIFFLLAGVSYSLLIQGIFTELDSNIWLVAFHQFGAFLLIPAVVAAMIVLITSSSSGYEEQAPRIIYHEA